MSMMNNWLSVNGFSKEEEVELYDGILADLYLNPRWYLDNLDYLKTFRVYWQNYRSKSATSPYKYVKKRNIYK